MEPTPRTNPNEVGPGKLTATEVSIRALEEEQRQRIVFEREALRVLLHRHGTVEISALEREEIKNTRIVMASGYGYSGNIVKIHLANPAQPENAPEPPEQNQEPPWPKPGDPVQVIPEAKSFEKGIVRITADHFFAGRTGTAASYPRPLRQDNSILTVLVAFDNGEAGNICLVNLRRPSDSEPTFKLGDRVIHVPTGGPIQPGRIVQGPDPWIVLFDCGDRFPCRYDDLRLETEEDRRSRVQANETTPPTCPLLNIPCILDRCIWSTEQGCAMLCAGIYSSRILDSLEELRERFTQVSNSRDR